MYWQDAHHEGPLDRCWRATWSWVTGSRWWSGRNSWTDGALRPAWPLCKVPSTLPLTSTISSQWNRLFAPFSLSSDAYLCGCMCMCVCVCVCVLRKEVSCMYNWTTVDVRNVSIGTTSLFHEETRGDGAYFISQWELKLRGLFLIFFIAVLN